MTAILVADTYEVVVDETARSEQATDGRQASVAVTKSGDPAPDVLD
jgi:hypothetical protein